MHWGFRIVDLILEFILWFTLKLLIGYGSRGKFFHLKEFCDELEKQNITVKLVKDTDFSRGFPSKRILEWFNGDEKFKDLINEYRNYWC